MILDIRNRPQRVRKGEIPFLNRVAKKYRAELDLSFDECERLIRVWDRVTEEG